MRIKISAGGERDIAEVCDFYGDIDPNLATYFHDSISSDIDSLLLYAGVHAKVDGWHYTFRDDQRSVLPITMLCMCVILFS